jgi:general secretion pathway protein G
MIKIDPRRKAFTLIEIMLVVMILVLLGGVGLLGYSAAQASARKRIALAMVNSAADQVRRYQMDMGTLPNDDDGLKALVTRPSDDTQAERWAGPYIKDGVIPVDPWGNELKYKRITRSGDEMGPEFEVFSYGPDGQEGTEDDISSAPKAKK